MVRTVALTITLSLLACKRPSPAQEPASATDDATAGGMVEAAAAPDSPGAMARHVFALAQKRDSAGIFALLNGPMKAQVSEAKLAEILAQLREAKGDWQSLEVSDEGPMSGEYSITAERGTWRMLLSIDEQGAVSGLRVMEAEAPPPLARTSMALRLPVRGQWFVFWGGDTAELNHHVDHPSQRRAVDLVVVGADGKTFAGAGDANGDYFAYGKQVVAVADGKVVTVVDGVPDNPPGELNAYMTTGNLVTVKHDEGVYSSYAHLVPGSSKVVVGDRVRAGQRIGACGNSGNSSEAHLHFQIHDGPRFEKSWGIEPIFDGVDLEREGARSVVDGYSWRKGDRVYGPER